MSHIALGVVPTRSQDGKTFSSLTVVTPSSNSIPGSPNGTEAGFKAGDSGNENVWRDGQFDPATRRRYGGRFHDLIVRHGGEAYFEGSGPRMWRVLAEFIIDWLAC